MIKKRSMLAWLLVLTLALLAPLLGMAGEVLAGATPTPPQLAATTMDSSTLYMGFSTPPEGWSTEWEVSGHPNMMVTLACGQVPFPENATSVNFRDSSHPGDMRNKTVYVAVRTVSDTEWGLATEWSNIYQVELDAYCYIMSVDEYEESPTDLTTTTTGAYVSDPTTTPSSTSKPTTAPTTTESETDPTTTESETDPTTTESDSDSDDDTDPSGTGPTTPTTGPTTNSTVTFDPNGGVWGDGTSAPVTVNANAGDEVKVPNAPEKEDDEFLHWKESKTGAEVNPGGMYKIPEEGGFSFDAVWKSGAGKNATASFDPDGGMWQDGTSAPKTVNAKAGDAIEIPEAPVKEDDEFLCWKESRSGKMFDPGDTYRVPKGGGYIFTAVWSESTAANVTVTFDPGDGTWADGTSISRTVKLNAGDRVTTPDAPIKENDEFLYWKDPNSGTVLLPGGTYPVSEEGEYTFDAVWQTDTTTNATVTFEPDGGEWADGTSDPRTVKANAGDPITLPEAPEKEKNTFLCWKEVKSGKEFQPGDTYLLPEEGSYDFGAVWELSTTTNASVSFHPDGGVWGDGTSAPKTFNVNAGDPITTPGAPLKANDEFLYWKEAESGSILLPGATYRVPKEGGYDFNAVWKSSTTTNASVTFDPRGGVWGDGTSAPKTIKMNADDPVKVPEAPAKVNDVFLGWKESKSGSVFKPGDTYRAPKEGGYEFTAVWKSDSTTAAEGNATTKPTESTKSTDPNPDLPRTGTNMGTYLWLGLLLLAGGGALITVFMARIAKQRD